MKRKTISTKIVDILSKMPLEQSLDKNEVIDSVYKMFFTTPSENEFIRRSFDVHLCKAKQEIKKREGKEFDSHINGVIKRIK